MDNRLNSRLGNAFPSASRRGRLALVAAALLGLWGPPSLAGEALSADAVRTLIVGNTLKGSYMTNPLVMVFYPDGLVRGAIGLTGSDSGTWELEGDKYCHEWFTYFSGVRRCYHWIPQGDGYLLKNADSFRGRNIQGRIEKGKPKGY